MKKIISYFLSGIVLCTALLVTPVSAAEVAPAEENNNYKFYCISEGYKLLD